MPPPPDEPPALDAAALAPWRGEDHVLATPASLYLRALEDGPSLQLGGNIHDYLVLLTCGLHGTGLATLDRRQAALADHVEGLDVDLLLEWRDARYPQPTARCGPWAAADTSPAIAGLHAPACSVACHTRTPLPTPPPGDPNVPGPVITARPCRPPADRRSGPSRLYGAPETPHQ